MVHQFSYREVIHFWSGIGMFVLTIPSYYITFKMMDYKIVFNKPNMIILNLCVFIGLLVMFNGIAALWTRQKENLDWRSDTFLIQAKIHRWAGYFVLFIGQVSMTIGIECQWATVRDQMNMVVAVGGANVLILGAVLVVLELRHQSVLRQADPFTKVYRRMTPAEFEEACKIGAQYAIVDEVVVDMAPFYKHHPGGVFTLKHNVGQDISKFFHGSYSMEGNLERRRVDRRVRHSNYARKIVNQLVVA
jgi:vacuolar-type H+-ATPase subunit I/STV1